ncbi:MAG: AMP-binding protein, partial [Candidatus Heimdallarchaeota archaeon]|nr:AMP-binding protein [Candidatus Heimdallarchaeota archaeon]
MSTQDFLVELVHSNPDKTCILGSKSDQFSYSAFSQPSIEKKGYVGYTYGDLLSLVERFVAGISKHNKEHQNNFITTILPTSVDLFVSILGTFASGHSLAFLDPSRGVRSALTLMGQIHSKFYFSTTKGSLLNLFRSGTKNFTCYSKLALPRRTKFVELGNHGSDNKFHLNKPSDAAITTFSSGTHGELKQVVRDHRVLFNQHKAITQVLGFKNDDMEYSTLPLFLLNAITSGIPIVLPKLSSPDVHKLNSKVATEIYDTFEKLPVTIFITSPAFLRKLTDYKLDIGKERSHQLRKIFVGGAPVSFSLLKSASQVWQTEIVAAYGSTEAEPIATFSSSEMV